MKSLKTIVFAVLILSLAGLVGSIGCAKKVPPAAMAPDWVMKGSAAFNEGGSRVFYGVGGVSGVKNKPLARTASENRARAEIGKVFETYTASLMRDYMASTTAGAAVTGESATSEEQHIEQAVKTFSATTLSGVNIIDHWIDPADGTVYALAKLDLEAFKNSLDKMKELSAAVRDYVRQNAEKSFDRLEAEEEKRGQ